MGFEVAQRRARGEDPFINIPEFMAEKRAEEDRQYARGLIDYLSEASEADITGKTEGSTFTSAERDAEFDRVMAESRALDAADAGFDSGYTPAISEEEIQRRIAESQQRQAVGEQTMQLLELQAALRAQDTMNGIEALETNLSAMEKQLDDSEQGE